ncbi:hypothetical protein [Legionella bononiensis]|uniref:Uncharacterized protein n=1 Tax=Legionella bononiensis TaxID=2793102 RepID=A0ABS1W761_9GAMM|nr:hypothetical protein [Legionella bononiensis]MBL7481294.1 hypothetical protein [Legionella bononiensis]MBL7525198.1 hypothetical protein [Legionella bononiensis]MBL7561381.1 hypothetical protein [Legionella bononiensis]
MLFDLKIASQFNVPDSTAKVFCYSIGKASVDDLIKKFMEEGLDISLLQNNSFSYLVLIRDEAQNRSDFYFSKDEVNEEHFDINSLAKINRVSTIHIKKQRSNNSVDTKTKAQQDKTEDLKTLEHLVVLIEQMEQLSEEHLDDLPQLFKEISRLAKSISYNDKGEHAHHYIRNKYGNINRHDNAKRRPNGLELTYLSVLGQTISTESDKLTIRQGLQDLKNDFSTIKNKIRAILNAEHTNKSPGSILAGFKISPHLIALVQYSYSQKHINRISLLLNDLHLLDLDYANKEHRYYLGRVLTRIGELSKELIDFLNFGKDSGVFTFFKKIRDKLAHEHQAMHSESHGHILRRITDQWIPRLKEALGHFKHSVLIPEEDSEPGVLWQHIMNSKVTLEVTSLTADEKRECRVLIDAFSQDHFALPEAMEPEVKEIHVAPVKAVKKTSRINHNVATMSPLQGLLELEKLIEHRQSIYNKKEHLLLAGIKQISKMFQLNIPIIKFIKNYNAKVLRDNTPEWIIPFEENKPLDFKEILSFIRTMKDRYSADLPASIEVPLIRARAERDQHSSINSPNKGKSEVKKVSGSDKKKLARVKCLADELEYANQLRQSESAVKKYALEFSISKIGQLIKDLLDKDNNLVKKFAPIDLIKSMTSTIKARNQLMHTTALEMDLDAHRILLREVLPITREIQAIDHLSKHQDLMPCDDQHEVLFKMAEAYIILKKYDEADVCYETLLKSPDLPTPLYIELVFSQAWLYELCAEEALAELNSKKANTFIHKKICLLEFLLQFLVQNDLHSIYDLLADYIYQGISRSLMTMNRFEDVINLNYMLLANKKTNSSLNDITLVNMLGNIASATLEKEIDHCNDQKVIENIGTAQIQQAAALFFELEYRYTQLELPKETSNYIAMLSSFIEALIWSAEVESIFQASSLFQQLQSICESTPMRENQPVLVQVNRLGHLIGFVSELINREGIDGSRSTEREQGKDVWELKKLYFLKSFYSAIGKEAELQKRIDTLSADLLSKYGSSTFNEMVRSVLSKVKELESEVPFMSYEVPQNSRPNLRKNTEFRTSTPPMNKLNSNSHTFFDVSKSRTLIKNQLHLLTGHSGWNISTKPKLLFWIEVPDLSTAGQIKEQLNKTNALKVGVFYKKGTTQPVVQCTDVNLSQFLSAVTSNSVASRVHATVTA